VGIWRSLCEKGTLPEGWVCDPVMRWSYVWGAIADLLGDWQELDDPVTVAWLDEMWSDDHG
jgi:hypothetical protein